MSFIKIYKSDWGKILDKGLYPSKGSLYVGYDSSGRAYSPQTIYSDILLQMDEHGNVEPIGGSSTGGTINVNSLSNCSNYEIIFDENTLPNEGEVVFNQSVYTGTTEWGEIYFHKIDRDGNDQSNFLDTVFSNYQFNMFWSEYTNSKKNSNNNSGQKFNQCGYFVESIECLSGTTGPTIGTGSTYGSVPIEVVYGKTINNLKTGGDASIKFTAYLDPLFIYEDVNDTGSSKFKVDVFRRDDMKYHVETPDESIKSYANLSLNLSTYDFDSDFYDGSQKPKIFLDEDLTVEAPSGYYIKYNEYTNSYIKYNAVNYTQGGIFSSKFPGWDYMASNPTGISIDCNVVLKSMRVIKNGDYYIIPWKINDVIGNYKPNNMTISSICIDVSGDFCSENEGSSGVSDEETLTALSYNDKKHTLSYVDEELSINVKILNNGDLQYDKTLNTLTYTKENGVKEVVKLQGGDIDFILNGSSGSTMVEQGNVLDLIEGDNVRITLSEISGGTASYEISTNLSLSGLTDVEITQPEDFQMIVYSGGTWINRDNYYSTGFTGNYVLVEHKLGRIPSITIFNDDGDEIEGQIRHLDFYKFELIFNNFDSYGNIICQV